MKNNKWKSGQGDILFPFLNTYYVLLREVAPGTGPTKVVNRENINVIRGLHG